MGDYKQLFVYVESERLPPTGLDSHILENYDHIKDLSGYVDEEYVLYKGEHRITRAEYDDGACVLMGKPVKLDGECELRLRYLSPYNMVICANDSSLNQSSFDAALKEHMNALLDDKSRLPELIESVRSLPRKHGY